MKKQAWMTLGLVGALFLSSVGECRVGGGRSFGSRGSRGFSAPRYQSPAYRTNPSGSYQSHQPQNAPTQRSYGYQQPQSSGGSFLRTMGAGLAGGFLGSMLFRGLTGGGYAGAGTGGYGGGGGFGLLEILLLGGVLFFLGRYLMNRFQNPQPSSSTFSPPPSANSDNTDSASALFRQARPGGWGSSANDERSDGVEIPSDTAMDLFFRVQGAWAQRDISPIREILDEDAKQFLEQDVARLKARREINRLENIAVRSTDVVESWREPTKEYSTVRFVANLLDFTVQEDTQQVVEGSKTSPVKFEEYWTFSKEIDSSSWKLSGIQQS